MSVVHYKILFGLEYNSLRQKTLRHVLSRSISFRDTPFQTKHRDVWRDIWRADNINQIFIAYNIGWDSVETCSKVVVIFCLTEVCIKKNIFLWRVFQILTLQSRFYKFWLVLNHNYNERLNYYNIICIIIDNSNNLILWKN